jgi:protein gp37
MATNSHIEWTDATWNPVTGCTKISPGCKHCYAERLAHRLQLMGQANYKNGFTLTTQPQMLQLPLTWKAPKRIFVNSMSDLFHKDVPVEYIRDVFDVMARADWHQFQVLTKRSERLRELAPELPWAPHIWMGVSVENATYVDRIDDLRATGAAVKFLSLEPLLGPMPQLKLKGIDWVIVGGESGPGARLMEEQWVLDIRNQCVPSNVAFFFKQWGGVQKSRTGRVLQGRTYDQMPEPLLAV